MLGARPEAEPFLFENFENTDEDVRDFSSMTLSSLEPVPLGSCMVLLSMKAAGNMPVLPLPFEPVQHQ